MTNDNIESKFIWAGDNLLALQQGNNSYSYVADVNKNIRQLVNNNTGAVVNNYEYSPLGKLYSSDEQISQPFKFSSEYADNKTNLVYYNYRYYNPKIGRWLSRDPIQENGGINIYGFVNNNPNYYYDHLGRDPRVEAATKLAIWLASAAGVVWSTVVSSSCNVGDPNIKYPTETKWCAKRCHKCGRDWTVIGKHEVTYEYKCVPSWWRPGRKGAMEFVNDHATPCRATCGEPPKLTKVRPYSWAP